MSSSAGESLNSDNAATNEEAALFVAPTPTANTNETLATVAPNPVSNAHPLSNTPAITDPNTVKNANPFSNTWPTATDPTPVTDSNHRSTTTDVVEFLLKFGFTLNSGDDSRPIDNQIGRLRIGLL